MMSNWKIGFKLIRYAYQVKLNIVCAASFFILGIISMCIGDAFFIVLGALWSLLGLLFLNQLLFYLEYAGMIASSPKRTALSFSAQDVVVVVGSILVYVIIVVIEEMKAHIFLRTDEPYSLFIAFLMMFWILLYIGIAYRLFILATILFCCASGFSPMVGLIWPQIASLQTAEVYVIGFVLVLVGIVLNCIIRRVLYRMPLSKLAAGAGLRKHL